MALLPQQDTLAYAKTVLLIDHGQPKIMIAHAVADQRMRADDNLRRAIGKVADDRFTVTATPLAKKQPRFQAKRCQKPVDGGVVLACQYFGRCQKRCLRARLNGVEHRKQRHQGLARPDISLQHPQHAVPGHLISADFIDGTKLCPGKHEWQAVQQRRRQIAGANEVSSRHRLSGGVTDKGEGKLIGQQFVKGKAASYGRMRHQIIGTLRLVNSSHGGGEIRPLTGIEQ